MLSGGNFWNGEFPPAQFDPVTGNKILSRELKGRQKYWSLLFHSNNHRVAPAPSRASIYKKTFKQRQDVRTYVKVKFNEQP